MKKPIVIVDDNDLPIGVKNREDVDYEVDTYRVAGIWVTNSQGEVLIAQRKFTKKHDPGKWGPAVAGTIEEGETYESNAYKELEEEIGIKDIELELGPKRHNTFPKRYFSQWFTCRIDRPIADFVIQEEEVEQIKWVEKDKLLQDVKNNPDKYIPSFPKSIELLMK